MTEGHESGDRGDAQSGGMADQHPDLAALRKLESSLQWDLLEREAFARARQSQSPRPRVAVHAPTVRDLLGPDYWRLNLLHWWLRLRKITYVAGAFAGLVLIAMTTLWW